MIYTQVAHSTTTIRLSKGDLVRPPFANTCRQIRQELSGKWYTEEVTLDQTLPITARFTDFDFTPLYIWLEAHDQRPAEHKKHLSVLDIEFNLTSPSSGTPGFASSPLATKTDVNKYGKDYFWMRKNRLWTDYKAILSCDDNWARTLDEDLFELGRATYGMDKSARSSNPRLFSETGARRRFAETLAGNGYLTSCNVRIEYLHHPRVPTPKKDGSANETAAPAHPALVHGPDYFGLLGASILATLPQASSTCNHALCVRQLRRRIFSGLAKARLASQELKWDRAYYSNLSGDAKRVVRFYRLLDPIPKTRGSVVRAALGKTDPRTGQKRSVKEVYARRRGEEGGFVDRAWAGCEKRRFGSVRGDRVLGKEARGGGDEGGGGDERDGERFGKAMLGQVDGLMRRLELDGRCSE